MKELEECVLCPIGCRVNRNKGFTGKCGAGDRVKIGLYSLHFDEEPCISGKSGSGTVFFSNCNLKCKFCQNYKISCEGKGEEVSIDELAEIFLEQQRKGAHNINLVTATPYILHVVEAVKIAKNRGLNIPILYNTSGYETVDTLRKLEGYVDIYLPDFKYYDNSLAMRLSGVDNYREVATEAILEMYRQVGENIYDENGMLQRGMIIRHLVLPNNVQNSIDVLKWIKENMSNDVMVSLMAQYFPTYRALDDSEINRRLLQEEYEAVENYLYELDFENGYVQDLGDDEEQYVPNF